MADPTAKGSKDAMNAAPDRVSMLSIRKDGSADQFEPEFLDEDFGREATRHQMVERAVSLVDEAKRPELGLTGDAGGTTVDADLDPAVADLKKAHEAAAKSAEAHADSLVKSVGTVDEASKAK